MKQPNHQRHRTPRMISLPSVQRRPSHAAADSLAMNIIVAILLFATIHTTAAGEVASRDDDALLVTARRVLPRDISTNEMVKIMRGGLWNSNHTALAISFLRPRLEASVIFVFLHQTNGNYLAVNASGVEGANLGVLGTRGRKDYDRFETTPVEWRYREDGHFQVVMRTRAWRAGRRYTVSEPLLISRSGTVLWR